MKLSAKSHVAVSFIASLALGAVAFAGCTVTSGTVDDTDGGTSSSTSSSGGSSSGSTSSRSGSTGDSGTDAASTCEPNNQTSDFAPPNYGAECQSCAESKCCNEVQACFNQDPNAGDDAGANVGCDDYKKCIDDCNTTGGDDDTIKACYDICDAATSQALITSFDIMQKCLEDNCGVECTPQ